MIWCLEALTTGLPAECYELNRGVEAAPPGWDTFRVSLIGAGRTRTLV